MDVNYHGGFARVPAMPCVEIFVFDAVFNITLELNVQGQLDVLPKFGLNFIGELSISVSAFLSSFSP